MEKELEQCVGALNIVSIKLKDRPNCLVWIVNKTRSDYKLKLGYQATRVNNEDETWNWHFIKLQLHLKTKIVINFNIGQSTKQIMARLWGLFPMKKEHEERKSYLLAFSFHKRTLGNNKKTSQRGKGGGRG